MSGCKDKNLLLRDGTSQQQRLLAELIPGYVSVDERDLADLILFAKRYARLLNYYDPTNKVTGNWREFIEKDVSTTISTIATRDTKKIKDNFKALMEPLSLAPDKDNYRKVLDAVTVLALWTDQWYKNSVDELSLKGEIANLIKLKLKEALAEVLASYKALSAQDSNIANQFILRLDPIWQLKSNLAADAGIFTRLNNPAQRTVALKLVQSLIDTFYEAVVKLVTNAPRYLQESLEQYPKHEPHIALFLAFIQIFRYAQKHINTITERHLDFYYKEVLGLAPKPAAADQVHIIFELAKDVSAQLVKAGTSLRAGKDKTGKDLYYRTSQDIVVNKAQVAGLKSVFVDAADNDKIYAAPVANSQDGLGKKLEGDEPKWPAFGTSQKGINLGERTMQDAQVGFAIASPVLLLNEGTRKITITVDTDKDVTAAIALFNKKNKPENFFKIFFSGEKEWLQLDTTKGDSLAVSTVQGNNTALQFIFTLSAAQPAILPYDDKVLKEGYNTRYPLVKILLNGENVKNKESYPYSLLKSWIVQGIKISISVQGVKNLIFQNDLAKLEPSKPFQPFGNLPVVGASFYIGSGEVFAKKLTSLKLNIEWQDLPDATAYPKGFIDYYASYLKIIPANTTKKTNEIFTANVSSLVGGKWIPAANNESLELFSKNKMNDSLIKLSGKPIDVSRLGLTENKTIQNITVYDANTQSGFIRLELNSPDFGHKDYSNLLISATVAAVKPKGTFSPVNPPYNPTIKSLSIDYDSTIEISGTELKDTAIQSIQKAGGKKEETFDKGKEDFDKRTEQFFHIHPFGQCEVHGYLVRKLAREGSQKSADANLYLLPSFTDEGNFYIGISNLAPPQNLSLLFQLADGSDNPEKKLPDTGIEWSYLSNNLWKEIFTYEVLSDTTNNLLISGITTLAIPKDITNNNTVLPPGSYWLKATIKNNSDAVCKVIDVKTQAVVAAFTDKGNDPDYLKSPLAASAISKMDVKDAAIAKVQQPYASFGGKVKEQGNEFYTRVSERLRHKQRAITITDYEKLVLEKFPSIYKVKCLSHTCISYEDAAKKIKCQNAEIAPGHVAVIAVSNLRNKNAVNPLEPKTSLNTLEAIRKYLQTLISPFVRLEVRNPKYEQVRVKADVAFIKGFDKGYYTEQLKQDLKKFLSPWAYEEGKDIVFGGKVHGSVIVDFIEEREYVDYLSDFKMFQKPDDVFKEVAEAEPGSSGSILVSADTHIINPVEAETI